MSSNKKRNNFIGYDGFVWWVGVVEDRNDPLNCGRCKVRIQGLHSEHNTSVNKETLPWAQPLFPTNNTFSTPSTLKEGDMVMGFFMDGPGAQHPIILGMFHGIPDEEPNGETGFNDQRTSDQLQSSPKQVKSVTYNSDGTGATVEEYDSALRYPYRINEPTTSRLSRNENIDQTIVKSKTDSVVKVNGPDGTESWSEPETKYAAKYPYNQATSTESGHYFELDDTPGAERVHLYHRSGSFTETHPDGSKVDKVVKDKYTIVMKDDHVYIMGDCQITVQGNANIYVKKNCDLTVDGDMTQEVKGNLDVTVKGDWNTTVSGSVNHASSGDTVIKASKIKLN